MFKQEMKVKADVIRWQRFSGKKDAVFRSLGREIVIGRLSAATLLAATVPSATAQVSVLHRGETETEEVTVEEVEVTASRVALPLGRAARLVSVMTHEQVKDCPAQSVNDLLKYVASVDVRQRGAFGIQTDISINGGTHDQIVILLNGVNVSSPHTGHLAADLPISIDDIERIEVLEGAASRVYGTSAFSGAINIVTRRQAPSAQGSTVGEIGVSGGSFGTLGVDGLLGHALAGRLSGGWQRSDGGTPNSDFEKGRAYYQGHATLGRDGVLQGVDVDWQLGMSHMDYGANTFYSGRFPDQHESNHRYMGAVSACTHGHWAVASTLYWNRSLDHYQLVHGSSTGENFHLTDVYGMSVNGRTTWQLGTTAVGAEVRNEGILSTALGRPLEARQYVDIPGHSGQYTRRDNRTNLCYFLEHDVVLEGWTVSAGVMANMNTALDYRYRLYPGVDVSWRPADAWHIYASWNMAQRMPTFTDLYYRSPTQEGNTGLKPEKTGELTLGTRWQTAWLTADLRLFHRHGKGMIDWVMTDADSVNGYTTFHAANFRLDNMGGSVAATLLLRPLLGAGQPLRSFSVNYSYLHQKRHDATPIYASSYALDYLRHKLVARLDATVARHVDATLTYRWQDRMGNYVHYSPTQGSEGTTTYVASTRNYRPYGLLDLRVQWTQGRWTAYAEGNNLTSHRYVDLGNVVQPGFWCMAGVKFRLTE